MQAIYFFLEYHLYKLLGISERIFAVNGAKMLLPLSPFVRGNDRRLNQKEPYTVRLLQEILKPGDTVIECGACLGEFSLLISRLIGSSGKLFSFEPMPNYRRFLQTNIQLNHLENIELVPLAVGLTNSRPIDVSVEDEASYTSISKLWDFKPKMQINSISSRAGLERVDVIALSDFVRSRGLKVNLLFTDIEGCETLVFQDLIQNWPREEWPMIYFESHQQIYGNEILKSIFDSFEVAGFRRRFITTNHFLLIPKELKGDGSAYLKYLHEIQSHQKERAELIP